MDGFMDGWMDGWMDGCGDRWMNGCPIGGMNRDMWVDRYITSNLSIDYIISNYTNIISHYTSPPPLHPPIHSK